MMRSQVVNLALFFVVLVVLETIPARVLAVGGEVSVSEDGPIYTPSSSSGTMIPGMTTVPLPEKVELTNRGVYWLEFQWEVSAEEQALVEEYILHLRISESESDADWHVVYQGQKSDHVLVDGLGMNRSYDFAVETIGSGGISSGRSTPYTYSTTAYSHTACNSQRFCLSWALDPVFQYAHFQVSAPVKGWMGVIVESNDGAMRDGDCWILYMDKHGTAHAEDYYSSGYRPPIIDPSQDLHYINGRSTANESTVWFSTMFDTKDENDYTEWGRVTPSNAQRRFAWAMHRTETSILYRHESHDRGRMIINLETGQVIELNNETRWIQYHMWAMLFAWCFLGQNGTFIAYLAYLSGQLSPSASETANDSSYPDNSNSHSQMGAFQEMKNGKKWYRAHRDLSILATLISVVGIVMAAKFKSDVGGSISSHGLIGYVLIILFIFLSTRLISVCQTGDFCRTVHKYTGRMLMVMILFWQIPSGLEMRLGESNLLPYWVFIIFWILLYVGSAVYVRVKKEMNPHHHVLVDRSDSLQGDMESGETDEFLAPTEEEEEEDGRDHGGESLVMHSRR